ncbi:MAG: cation:proton antiporter [SAR202 cluster bacterium]|nr:cation:proton antiporter [SAR202 cluster bacterium]
MEDFSFLPLLVVSGLAFAVPVVLSRFRHGLVPIVAGELLAGIAFGRAGLGIIKSDPASEVMATTDPEQAILTFLSLFGFAFLMFLAGLQVDFGLLSRRDGGSLWRWQSWIENPLLAGCVIFVLTLGLALVAAWLLPGANSLSRILVIGLILSTTSVGIVVPTLRERGLSRSPIGQTILMAAFVADFATVVLLTLLAGLMEGENVVEVALIAVLFAAFFLAIRVGDRAREHSWVSATLGQLAHATAQIQVRGALALMIVFVVLAETLEAELILGAFLAGAAISSLSREEGSSLREKLDAIGYGFFVPFFFITVGASFDPGALGRSTENLALIPALLVAAIAVKILPSLCLRLKFTWRETLSAGVLLSPRLSLIIAASVVGLRLGVIDEATNSSIILVALVTSTLAPAIFARLSPRLEPESSHVIVVGAGEVGSLLGVQLAGQHMRPVLVEQDPERAARAASRGLEVVTGSALSPEVLAQAGALGADAIVAATADAETNRRICLLARDSFNVKNLLARVDNPRQRLEFDQYGIRALSEPMALAIALDSLLVRPDIFRVIAEPRMDVEILEASVLNRQFVGHPIHLLPLPGDATVILVRRGQRPLVPHTGTLLEMGDLVTLAGDAESVAEGVRLLEAADNP